MILTGHQDVELEVINCDVVNVDVVTRYEEGYQAMGKVGLALEIKQDLTPRIPEDCPLTKPRKLRELANFAVCTQCSHATLKYPHSIVLSRNNSYNTNFRN